MRAFGSQSWKRGMHVTESAELMKPRRCHIRAGWAQYMCWKWKVCRMHLLAYCVLRKFRAHFALPIRKGSKGKLYVMGTQPTVYMWSSKMLAQVYSTALDTLLSMCCEAIAGMVMKLLIEQRHSCLGVSVSQKLCRGSMLMSGFSHPHIE